MVILILCSLIACTVLFTVCAFSSFWCALDRVENNAE